MKFLFGFILALFFCGVVFGQATATTSDGKKVILGNDGTWKYAPPPDKDTPVIVYIYRLKEGGVYNRARSIFIDGKESFEIKQGDFVGIKLISGSHSFKTNKDDSEITIETKSGELYFVLLTVSSGGFAQTHVLTEIPQSQAELQLKKTTIIDAKQIKSQNLLLVKEKPNQ